MLQLYYGDGKGKTTAAIGLLVRTRGADLPAAVLFFDKGGTHYHERAPLTTLGVSVVAVGRDRIDPVTQQFDFSITSLDRAEALRGLEIVKTWLASGVYRLIILDEVLNCIRLGTLTIEEVRTIIEPVKKKCEIVLTGRGVPVELLAIADLATEFREEKHYFRNGTSARAGIDF